MAIPDNIKLILDNEGINDELAAKGLAQVIRGETIKEVFDSEGQLQQRQVLRKPDDVARGLMLYDTMTGGRLGLTPKTLESGAALELMYAQFAPTVDDRIVPSKRISSQLGASKVEIIDIESPPEPKLKDGSEEF